MRAVNIYRKFLVTVKRWEDELMRYCEEDLKKPTGKGLWTVGQIYEHITASTLNFHAGQIEECLRGPLNLNKRKKALGYLCLLINRIPPIPISIPQEENIEPIQPEGKLYLFNRLQELRDHFSIMASRIDAADHSGKTFHPGMGYLRADEWFALIEMHLRYHLKEKKEADRLLSMNSGRQSVSSYS